MAALLLLVIPARALRLSMSTLPMAALGGTLRPLLPTLHRQPVPASEEAAHVSEPAVANLGELVEGDSSAALHVSVPMLCDKEVVQKQVHVSSFEELGNYVVKEACSIDDDSIAGAFGQLMRTIQANGITGEGLWTSAVRAAISICMHRALLCTSDKIAEAIGVPPEALASFERVAETYM